MSTFKFETPGPLHNGPLSLELHSTTPEDTATGHAAAYHFKMWVEDKEVGNLNFRAQTTPYVEEFIGHLGYHIHPAHRGHNYAFQACQLILPLARAHGFSSLIITSNPGNLASRRICEKLGAHLLNIVDIPVSHPSHSPNNTQKARYQLTL